MIMTMTAPSARIETNFVHSRLNRHSRDVPPTKMRQAGPITFCAMLNTPTSVSNMRMSVPMMKSRHHPQACHNPVPTPNLTHDRKHRTIINHAINDSMKKGTGERSDALILHSLVSRIEINPARHTRRMRQLLEIIRIHRMPVSLRI